MPIALPLLSTLVPKGTKPPCDKCNGACCRDTGRDYAVMLSKREAPKYSEAIDFREFTGEMIRVLPYRRGKCVYLSAEDRCTIYQDRPKLCRTFDCISPYNASVKRGQATFFIEDNPAVALLIEKHC